jgi:hypothetical protein
MSAALEEVKERLKWFAAELVKVLKDDSLSPDQFYIELLRLKATIEGFENGIFSCCGLSKELDDALEDLMTDILIWLQVPKRDMGFRIGEARQAEVDFDLEGFELQEPEEVE